MKRIGILANCSKPDARHVLQVVSKRAAELGLELITAGETCEFLPEAAHLDPDTLPEAIEVLIVFGGDGTMLSSVRSMGENDVPMLGVNLGSLGFMSSVPEEDAVRALEVIAEGTYTMSTRSTAVCRLYRNGTVLAETYRSLNDMVVGWGESSRVVTFTVMVNRDKVTAYLCDGIIVSTPTGSTGHQLSAGGPIVYPESPVFVLNVICPHTLSTRPLVLPDDSVIGIQVTDTPKELILAVDGQESCRVRRSDLIEIERSPRNVRFLHLPGYNYFTVLRHKLGWRGSVK